MELILVQPVLHPAPYVRLPCDDMFGTYGDVRCWVRNTFHLTRVFPDVDDVTVLVEDWPNAGLVAKRYCDDFLRPVRLELLHQHKRVCFAIRYDE
jgi:hypothetical protein